MKAASFALIAAILFFRSDLTGKQCGAAGVFSNLRLVFEILCYLFCKKGNTKKL
jgi:hypothetical protein